MPVVIALRSAPVSALKKRPARAEAGAEGAWAARGCVWLGWGSSDSHFNSDYHVSFTKPDVAKGGTTYNYKLREEQIEGEAPGVSVFTKDEHGAIFHTYSSYARGGDLLIGTYNYLDLTPKGRNEEGDLAGWVRRHDEYER